MNMDKPITVDFNEELVKRGLECSCESLGFFLREKVELETLRFSDAGVAELHVLREGNGKEIILHSEIIGQVGGQCFFLLNLEEANMLFKRNFTAGTTTPQKQIFEAFLLELDNIITASVVTEFANHLQLKIFGGIPSIFYREDENKLQEVMKKTEGDLYSINFKCRYKIQGIEFSPMFFWVLESKFPEIVSSRYR
jgi:hypothetical protein